MHGNAVVISCNVPTFVQYEKAGQDVFRFVDGTKESQEGADGETDTSAIIGLASKAADTAPQTTERHNTTPFW